MIKIKESLKYFLVIVGGSLVGIGESWILIPLKITTGGFNGIGMLVYYLCKVPIGLVSIFLNLPLFYLKVY